MATRYNASQDLCGDRVAEGRGDALAVITRTRSVSYRELSAELDRVATGLIDWGMRPEDRIALVMLDSVEFYAVFLGAMRVGVVPVLVNPLLPGRDVAAIVEHAKARLVFASERTDRIDALTNTSIERAVVVGEPAWADLVRARDGTAAASRAQELAAATLDESPGFWLCTSGSTGAPKLAMHRQIDLRLTADTYARHVLDLRPGDRCYSVGPMFHAYGLGNSLTFPFAAGASALVEPTRPPTPALIAELVGTYQPTHLFCIPTFFAALCASDIPDDTFRSVRMAVSAAEPLPADTFHRFKERFGVEIFDGIGSTEMTHIYLSNAPGAVRPGTSGTPVPGYDVRIVDHEGREVGDETAGHLEVRGDSMACGYWLAADSSRQTFRGEYMRTGDMYERSKDGYYTYLGRSDDMLRVGGEWVSPAEVEGTLVEHPSVLEAAVVGERDDNGVLRPLAFVVAVPGATVDVGELEVLCKANLAGFKRPRHYEVVDSLPKTATGKIQRYKLRRDA